MIARSISPRLRSLIAAAVIAVGGCVGGYTLLVLPMKRELARAAGEVAGARAAIDHMSRLQATLPEMIARRELARRRIAVVRDASRVAEDEGVLYAEVSALAAGAGLRVSRLAPLGAGLGAARGQATSARWSMEVAGSYGALALFLQHIEERLGVSLVRGVVITPDQTRVDTVVASIETEHFTLGQAGAAPEQRDAP